MADTKTLKPPFVWSQAKQLVEDSRYKRWTIQQLRDMKHGTYDWKTHEEHTV